jgi:hypothetical protein
MRDYTSPQSDIVDLEDLAKRLAEITDELDDHQARLDEGDETYLDDYDLQELRDERDRIQEVEDQFSQTLAEAARNDSTMVSEYYWQAYAESFADDVGMVDTDSSMYPYIDWERWAEDLKMDYTSIEYGGVTFYTRAY